MYGRVFTAKSYYAYGAHFLAYVKTDSDGYLVFEYEGADGGHGWISARQEGGTLEWNSTFVDEC